MLATVRSAPLLVLRWSSFLKSRNLSGEFGYGSRYVFTFLSHRIWFKCDQKKTQPRTMCAEGGGALHRVTNDAMVSYITTVFLPLSLLFSSTTIIRIKYMDFNLMTLQASRHSIKCGGIKREGKKSHLFLKWLFECVCSVQLSSARRSSIQVSRPWKWHFTLFSSSELSRQCLLAGF